MAKGMENTTKYQKEMKELNVHKKYLARVGGKVSEKEFVIDIPIYCQSMKNSRHAVALTEDQLSKSKPAKTSFTFLSYNSESDTSLLECRPQTGRTHQIRVHLQHYGHSILNDVNYGGRAVGNPRVERLLLEGGPLEVTVTGKREPTLAQDLLDENGVPLVEQGALPKKKILLQGEDGPVEFDVGKKKGTTNNHLGLKKDQDKQVECLEENENVMFFNYGSDDTCKKLKYTPFDSTRMTEIYLHSIEYEIKGKKISCKKPYWAEDESTKESEKPQNMKEESISAPKEN